MKPNGIHWRILSNVQSNCSINSSLFEPRPCLNKNVILRAFRERFIISKLVLIVRL
jgi:hypothetical protein